jgi:hypothetical protein
MKGVLTHYIPHKLQVLFLPHNKIGIIQVVRILPIIHIVVERVFLRRLLLQITLLYPSISYQYCSKRIEFGDETRSSK